MQTVTRDEVRKLQQDQADFKLVDALPVAEYEKSHIPGAISLPLEGIRNLAPKLLPDKDEKIITYCANKNCPASAKAAETLSSLGYTDVAAYEGGKDDWKNAGLSLEGSMATVSSDMRNDDMRSKPDELEEGHGEADAVSSRTTDDLEEMARSNGEPPEQQPGQREGIEL